MLADAAQRMAENGDDVDVVGFLNDQEPSGSNIANVPILGPFEHWKKLPPQTRFAAHLHKAGDMAQRINRIESLGVHAERWFGIYDPTSAVGRGCRFGVNVYLGAHSVVKPMTGIGNHACVRDGASIGHDVILEDFSFVGANATLGGYVNIGKGAFVGLGSVIREHVTIGAMSTVGMGAVVLDDVAEGAVVVGNPARVIPRIGC